MHVYPRMCTSLYLSASPPPSSTVPVISGWQGDQYDLAVIGCTCWYTSIAYVRKCSERLDLCASFDRASVQFTLKSLPTLNHIDCSLLKISCIIMQNRVHIMGCFTIRVHLQKLHSSPVLTVEPYFDFKVLLPKH